MELYRYTTLKRLQEMVLDKRLTLVNPFKCWEDTYEGAFYKAANDPVVFQKLVGLTHHRNDDTKTLESLKKLLSNYSTIRAQSWSLSEDSIVMWNVYSNNREAVMIITDDTRMNAVFSDNHPTKAGEHCEVKIPWMAPVVYKIQNNEDNEKVIITLFDETTTSIQPYAPLLIKHNAFSYENEYRIFLTNSSSDTDLAKLSVEKPQEFIKGVMVHPGASEVFVGEVRNFCEARNIMFYGKSQK